MIIIRYGSHGVANRDVTNVVQFNKLTHVDACVCVCVYWRALQQRINFSLRGNVCVCTFMREYGRSKQVKGNRERDGCEVVYLCLSISDQ